MTEEQRAKPPTLTWAIDSLTRGEENGKQKKEKEKQGAGPQPRYPRTLGRLS